MKRLLLLALPALLAGCTNPRETGDPGRSIVTNPAAAAAKDTPAEAAPTEAAPTEAAPPADPAPADSTSTASTSSTADANASNDAPAADTDEFTRVTVVRAAATLTKHQWTLASATDMMGKRIEALLVRPGQPVTLDFKGSQVTVGNTCNPMSGSYQPRGQTIVFGKLASTRKACVDAKLMALDTEVGKRLEGKQGLRMTRQGPLRIEFRNATGDILVFDSRPSATNPKAAKR